MLVFMRREAIVTFAFLVLCCANVGALVAPESLYSVTSKFESFEDESTLQDPPTSLTYNHLRRFDVVLCCCDKCGSTSLYDYVYEALSHHKWPYGATPPWRQQLYSPRWLHRFHMLPAKRLGSVKYKFALTRDPIDRLISAYKSKYACDGFVGHVNATDRAWMIPQLYALARREGSPKYCISLLDFAELLQAIHRHGNAHRLDVHIRPQQFECFRHLPARNWTKAVPIADPSFARELGQVLGAPDLKMPHMHASAKFSNLAKFFTPSVRSLLEEVTRTEYQAIGMRPEDSRWLQLPTS